MSTETKPPLEIIEPALASPLQLPAVADKHAGIVEKKAARKREDKPASIVNIATAIAGITSEVGVISKLGTNKFHGYKFAQMQDVLQKITPLIAKHGLIIVQTEIGRNMLDDGRAVAVEYEFTIAHTSGEVWPDRPKQTGLCRCRDSKGGFDDKCFNKAHTAARKYFLLALFQIATGEEDDADEHDTGFRPPPKRPAPKHDANTGEIFESDATATRQQSTEAKEAAPAANGGAEPMSLESMAREAAARGRDVFRTFWRNRSAAEQKQLEAIGAELKTLMAQAKDAQDEATATGY
jgi:hypothetical protein